MHLLLVIFILSWPAWSETTEPSTLYDWRLVAADSPDRELSMEELVTRLADSEVIVVGEYHGHSAIHLFQLRLLQALYRDTPDLALVMEQFSRDKQAVVNRYLDGELGERDFRDQSEAWRNYPASYRPLVEFAKARQLPVLAANAPAWLVRCLAQEGPDFLAKLSPTQAPWVAAQLDLADGAYKQQFETYFGGRNETVSKFYVAQVGRDETMAETVVDQLASNPGQRQVLVAGSFHVAYHLGTVERILSRRPQTRLVVITPIQGAPQDEAGTPGPAGDFLLQVAPLPPAYLDGEQQAAPNRQHSGKLTCQPPPN